MSATDTRAVKAETSGESREPCGASEIPNLEASSFAQRFVEGFKTEANWLGFIIGLNELRMPARR